MNKWIKKILGFVLVEFVAFVLCMWDLAYFLMLNCLIVIILTLGFGIFLMGSE